MYYTLYAIIYYILYTIYYILYTVYLVSLGLCILWWRRVNEDGVMDLVGNDLSLLAHLLLVYIILHYTILCYTIL